MTGVVSFVSMLLTTGAAGAVVSITPSPSVLSFPCGSIAMAVTGSPDSNGSPAGAVIVKVPFGPAVVVNSTPPTVTTTVAPGSAVPETSPLFAVSMIGAGGGVVASNIVGTLAEVAPFSPVWLTVTISPALIGSDSDMVNPPLASTVPSPMTTPTAFVTVIVEPDTPVPLNSVPLAEISKFCGGVIVAGNCVTGVPSSSPPPAAAANPPAPAAPTPPTIPATDPVDRPPPIADDPAAKTSPGAAVACVTVVADALTAVTTPACSKAERSTN